MSSLGFLGKDTNIIFALGFQTHIPFIISPPLVLPAIRDLKGHVMSERFLLRYNVGFVFSNNAMIVVVALEEVIVICWYKGTL